MANPRAYFAISNDQPCTTLNGQLVDVIKNLQAELDKVPLEYQHLVQIDFTSDYDGGMDYDIGYYRNKTDAEMEEENARTVRLKQEAEKRKQEQKVKDVAAEKRLYKRLKKKYEG